MPPQIQATLFTLQELYLHVVAQDSGYFHARH